MLSMGSRSNKIADDLDKAVVHRLEATVPTISQIRRLFLSPSFSVGVSHHGHTIFMKGFGYSDIKSHRIPDSETIYNTDCCTKAFTATIVSLLIQAGRLDIDAPVSEYLPQFQSSYSPDNSQKATIRDILSQSAGLASLPYAMMGLNGSVFAQPNDIVHVCSNLPSVSGHRSKWHSNDWMYALAARIVDQVSDTSWTQCVQIVLQGLGLQRTFTNHPADDNNFARRYVIFGHGDLEEVVSPSLEGGDALEGSGSMRTCVADMLKWCKILFLAPKITDSTWEDGSQPLYPFTPAKPDTLTKERLLRAARTIQQPGFPLTALDTKQNYALGLYNFTLPTERINTVTNAPNITSTYVMGAKSPSRKVIGHTGDMGNFASAYWVFPETESAIVVLTNSSRANGDPSNIVAQVLTQALFGLKPSINYIKLATDVVTQAKSQWQRTVTSWEVHRWAGTMPKDLDAYVGVYSSSDLRMTLDIKPISQVLSSGEPAKLRLWINGLTEQTFELYHYHHDSWTFLPGSRDKCLALGLEIYIPSWRSFILDFDNYVAGRLNTLRWTLDPDQRVKAQIFTRQGKS